MSISIHKVGLNKTLGQKSDEIITTNLVGKWVGGTGVETLYWDNQVSGGKNLRRFNGISASSIYFSFDGTDDYLGEASTSYGGDPFTFNTSNAFTIGMWIRSGTNGQKFYFESWHSDGYGFWLEITSASTSNNIKMDTNGLGVAGCGQVQLSTRSISTNTWHYITLTHDGSGNYYFYINGSFQGSMDLCDHGSTTATFRIGKKTESSTAYAGNDWRLSDLHVYTARLTDSQIRQNFLASNLTNGTRRYE
tara:strand:- start:468 stop:1214 length:747 start_codon:yes stop_codon:yes gene_type:complete